MNPPFHQWLALLLVALSVQTVSALDLTSPPPDGIYDPARVLDADFEQAIRQRIAYEKNFLQFEIFLVLLPEAPSQPMEDLATEVGEAWATGEFWAVIYQIGPTGDPDGVVGGDLMKQVQARSLQEALTASRNIALMVPTPQNRLEEFVNHLAQEFSFLNQLAQKNFDKAAAAFQEKEKQRQRQKDLARVAAMALSVVAILLLILSAWLWKKVGQKLLPQTFLITEPRTRLGGPASGGGNVLVKYRK